MRAITSKSNDRIDLTSEQKAVIHSGFKRIGVNAGPGTGKTTTLCCYALKQANRFFNDPSSWVKKDAKILVVSLTNYAANNAEATAFRLIKDENIIQTIGPFYDVVVLDKIVFSTIHAFSYRMLKRYNAVNRNLLVVMDNESNEELIQDIITYSKPTWKGDETIMRTLLDINSTYIGDKDLKDMLDRKYPDYSKHSKVILRILKRLDEFKQKENIITFDDMISGFYKLLHKGKIRNQIIRKYPVILVDEFQDTGKLQWAIIKKLIGPKSRLLCAGDNGQTIFTWANASFYRFKHFQQRFPSAKMYTLTQNKRSTKQIMNLSNSLIAQSKAATKKVMKSNADGIKPMIFCKDNLEALLKFITHQINGLLNAGESLDNIAIIYRFYKDTHYLKEHLTKNGIPFRVFGDKSKRDRPIIKLIFSLIKIIESHVIQRDNWEPVLLKIEGVGHRRADEILKWLKDKDSRETMYPKKLKFTESLKDLLDFVYTMKKSTSPNRIKLEKIIKFVHGLPKVNRALTEHIQPTLFMLAHEAKNLSNIIGRYNDRSYPLYYPTVFEPPYPDHYLTLSTVHRIKGGEFGTVFYLGTNDVLFEEYGLFKNKKRIENELQLMNVAVTRACRNLHLLFPISSTIWKKAEKVSNPWIFFKRIDATIYDLM